MLVVVAATASAAPSAGEETSFSCDSKMQTLECTLSGPSTNTVTQLFINEVVQKIYGQGITFSM